MRVTTPRQSLFATCFTILALAALAPLSPAQEETPPEFQFEPLEGTVDVLDGLATIDLPAEWVYLADREARTFVEKVWGNPPDPTVCGIAFPPVSEGEGEWGIVVSYEEDGYVSDEDAGSIDFDEMMESMQDDQDEGNDARRKAGYPSIEIFGWAEPPHYDSTEKKIYWAQDLLFGGGDGTHTLNYDVRILGRRGVLVMTAVGDVDQLEMISAGSKELLAVTHFNAGHRYEDFEEGVDSVAAYGLGGLIAGKVAMKVGLFKGLMLMLAKGWKIVVIAVVALGGTFRKLFGGGGATRRSSARAEEFEADEEEEAEASA